MCSRGRRLSRFFRAWVVPLLVFSAFYVASCGRSPYDSIRNLRSPGEQIICFGDSLTEGVGAGEGEDYPAVLAQKLGIAVINAGRRGDTTAAALARIRRDVLEKNPRLVIVLLGGNDFLRQVPLGETKKHLTEIVRQIQAGGAMVAIGGVRLGLFTDEYGPLFEEIAGQAGALYVPHVLKGILSDAKQRSDTIHPNAAGYRVVAERMAKEIRPLLQEADRRRGASVSG
jgi:acyl-CoA thioesterase-1